MRKTKTIKHSDPRPRLKNALRAADEFINRKKYIPPETRIIGDPAPDWIVTGDPCPCGTLETFTRIESSGFGTSEFGPIWQQQLIFTTDEASVNGTHGIIETPTDTGTINEWVDVSSGLALPVEILFKASLRWNWDSSNFDIQFALDSQPDPQSSLFWTYFSVYTNGANGPFGSHFFELFIVQETSEAGGVGFSPTPVWTSPTVAGLDYVEVEFYIRHLLETNAVRSKIWIVGASEPGAWMYEDTGTNESAIDGKLVSVGILGTCAGDGVSWSTLKIDSIEITEGDVDCIGPSFGGSLVLMDDFNRLISSGWGTCNMGWSWTLGSFPHGTSSVNGSQGYISINTGQGRVLLTNDGPYSTDQLPYPVPFDLFVDISWGNIPTDTNVFGNSISRVQIRPGFSTLLGTINIWAGNGSGVLEILDDTGVVATQLVGLVLNMPLKAHIHVNGSSAYANIWLASSEESSAWNLYATSQGGIENFATLQIFSGTSGSGASSLFESYFDNIYYAQCGQSIVSSSGRFALQGVFGAPETLGAIIPGILAKCTRITATQYDLPSDALYVKNVYIDNVQLSNAKWSFTFNSGKRLVLLSAVPTTSEVWARYVPVA